MATIQIRMFNLTTMGVLEDQPFSLDCWRATLIFVSNKPGTTVFVDGIPWDFLVDSATGTGVQQRIELGGCYLNGRPVNIKHDLRISVGSGDPFQCLIVLQNFVDDGS